MDEGVVNAKLESLRRRIACITSVADANRIKLEGAATALAAKAQVEAFGGAEIRLAQEVATQITNTVARSGMPVVPNVVVGSGINGGDAIAAMVLSGQALERNMTAARERTQ